MKHKFFLIILGLLSVFSSQPAQAATWSAAEYADLTNYPFLVSDNRAFGAAYNNNDQVIVVMTESDTPNNLYVAGFNKNAGWGPLTLIGNDRELPNISSPTDYFISLNDDGNFVVGYKNASNFVDLYAITGHLSTDSTITLNTEEALDIGASALSSIDGVSINNSGHAIALFRTDVGGDNNILVQTYAVSTNTWSATTMVNTAVEAVVQPFLTLNNSDQLIVSWKVFGGGYNARSGVWGTTPTWDSTPVVATASTTAIPYAGPTLNDNGFALFTYELDLGGLEYVTWTSSGGWSAPVSFGTPGAGSLAHPALNNKNEAIVITFSSSPVGEEVFSFTPSTGMVLQDLFPGGSNPGAMSAINENSRGLIIYPTADTSVKVSEENFGEAWTFPTVLSSPTNLQFSKGIGINDNDFGIALWANQVGGNYVLMFATIQFSPATFPLKGRQIRFRAPFVKEFINQLEWNSVDGASYYNIYRDGAFIARVDGSGQLRFNDRDQKKNVPVAYSINALNSAGTVVGSFNLTVP